MLRVLRFAIFICLQPLLAFAIDSTPSTNYRFPNDPIDVVICSVKKDQSTLDLCIEGIKANGTNIRRVIVISPEKLTDKAEWYCENNFPFSKYEVALYLNNMDRKKAKKFMKKPGTRLGWYYKMLLNFYATYVIPGISSNVLCLDSDTIFFRPVSFLNKEGAGLYCPGTEYHEPYFVHCNKMLPGLVKVFPDLSGISHHMLFQRPVLDDLFAQVKNHYHKEFWKAFCLAVDPEELDHSGAADYEIYFNFAFLSTKQVELRFLKWDNSGILNDIPQHKAEGYDFMSYHSFLRN